MLETVIRATFLMLLTAISGPCLANESPRELLSSIAAYVDRYHENGDFSGIVAVSVSGEVEVVHSTGFLRLGEPRKPTLDDSFHVASITKTFTAAAIRGLYEDGLLDLEDPLSRFVPEFPGAQEITIRHLLNHESGVPDFWAQSDVFDFASRPVSLSELVAWIGSKQREFPPGTRTSYSNSGYALLAAVIESVSGQEFHEYLSERISRPAGLTDTARYSLDADAEGYQPAFGPTGLVAPIAYDPSILAGSGSLKSSARDLLAWCEAFNSDFNDPDKAPFLYGWGARQNDLARWAEQTGRNPGFAAHIRAYPDSQTCVVLLSNIESQAVAAIGSGVADLAFGQNQTPPERRLVIDGSPAELADYVGSYRIGPATDLEIRLTDAGLELRSGSGPYLPMEPVGKDRFFYRQLYVEIHGRRDGTGAIDGLLWDGSYLLPRIGED